MRKLRMLLVTLMFMFLFTGCTSASQNAEDWYNDRVYVSDSGEYFLAELEDNNLMMFKAYDSFGNLTFIWPIDFSEGKTETYKGETVVKYDWTDPLNNSKNGVWYYPAEDEVVRTNSKAATEVHYLYACSVDELDEVFSQPTQSNEAVEPEVSETTTDVHKYECFDTTYGDIVIQLTGLYSGSDWVEVEFYDEGESLLSVSLPYEEFYDWGNGVYQWSADYMGDPGNTITVRVSYGELIWKCDNMYNEFNGTYVELPDMEE